MPEVESDVVMATRSRVAGAEVYLRVVRTLNFFHHNQPVSTVTYTQLARCENDPLMDEHRGVPVS
jgi:hypothetical protein